MASTPPLIRKDTGVPKESYFVTIDLHATHTKPITGIFVPENYKVSNQVDMILWLMGHHSNALYPPGMAIDDYWVKYPHFKFREFVNKGNKNVVLVAPSLGPGSESGDLLDQDGLKSYLDQVLAALLAYGPFQALPALNNLVIACHSGGGSPMRKICNRAQPYLDNIKELWGFDCLYSDNDPATWLQWARSNSAKTLMIRYGNGGTADRSRLLKRLAARQSNIDVDGRDTTEHNTVPVTYWNTFMRAAQYFADK